MPEEKKTNTGAIVAGGLATLGLLGALIGVAASSGKKPARGNLGRPPAPKPVRGRGCGRKK